MTSESMAARVKVIMVQVLDLDVPPEQIDDELSLYSSRIRLDSLGFLHLIIALEAEFDCQIEDEDVMVAEPLREGAAPAGHSINYERMP